jgi:hypothetical protein
MNTHTYMHPSIHPSIHTYIHTYARIIRCSGGCNFCRQTCGWIMLDVIGACDLAESTDTCGWVKTYDAIY